MILKIVQTGSPVLRQKAKPVIKIDKKISKLIKDMRETLVSQKNPEGVGLAAPQIGKSLRIFLMKNKDEIVTVINPKIVKKYKNTKSSPDDQKILEGCLSVLNYYGPMTRPKKIKISYMDENGKQTTKQFSGFPAQIVQHEMDHLEGVLFIDKLLKEKKSLYKQNREGEWEKVEWGK